MKIVQALGWYYPDSLGGTERYVAGLGRRLRAAGHDVLVAAPDAAAPGERRYEHEGMAVFRYPVPARPTRAESQGRAPVRGAEGLHRWLAGERPDIVHLHSLVTGLGLGEARAGRAAGARIVVTSHTPSLGWICQRGTMMRGGRALCDGLAEPAKCAACALEQRGLGRGPARAVAAVPPALGARLARVPGGLGTALGMSALIAHNQARQRELFGLAERFVVLTEWARRAALANGAPPERLVLSRLGAEPAGPAAARDGKPRRTAAPVKVGYLGRLDAIKGVHDLVRAVRSLPPGVPLGLEVRGPAHGAAGRAVRAELERLAGGDPRIALAAAVAPDESAGVLAGYDVLCCPSLCLEGGPTVALEAHAVGTPVVGTRVGGLAELITDGVDGRLVEPGDWRGLADVLRAVAEEPATVDRWRGALPRARTMDEVAADHATLYATVLGAVARAGARR